MLLNDGSNHTKKKYFKKLEWVIIDGMIIKNCSFWLKITIAIFPRGFEITMYFRVMCIIFIHSLSIHTQYIPKSRHHTFFDTEKFANWKKPVLMTIKSSRKFSDYWIDFIIMLAIGILDYCTSMPGVRNRQPTEFRFDAEFANWIEIDKKALTVL